MCGHHSRMTTARAVLLSALLIAIAIGGATWWSVPRLGDASRYSLVNAGDGIVMRLDRQTGDLIACRLEQCRQMARGDKLSTPAKDEWEAFPRVE